MKNLILLVILAFSIAACKKDYPKDIPQWVKNTILNCKRGLCCYDGAGIKIIEFRNTEDDSKIYILDKYVSQGCKEYYDSAGNFLCRYGVFCPGDTCGTIPHKNLEYKRLIWQENKNKCR